MSSTKIGKNAVNHDAANTVNHDLVEKFAVE